MSEQESKIYNPSPEVREIISRYRGPRKFVELINHHFAEMDIDSQTRAPKVVYALKNNNGRLRL